MSANLPVFQAKDFKSDLKPIWCPGCGDYGVVQAMYRALGLYLYRFVASDILTLGTRNNLNVIFTTHLKRESEEAVQGNSALKARARKVILNSDIAPMIEGGFRNKFEGLVGASLYLEKKLDGGSLKYSAICDVSTGLGTIVMAKNRFGLPARLALSDKTLYQAVMEGLGKAKPAPVQVASSKPQTQSTGQSIK